MPQTRLFQGKWRYNQINHFLKTLPLPLRSIQDLNGNESIFNHKDPPQHCISQFYGALTNLQSPEYPAYLIKWESDLCSTLTSKKKDKILHLAHVSSLAWSMVESNYKLLIRWHYTPAKLHRIFPSNSPLFWRNCGSDATHAHIWWSCPLIRPYWSKVLNLIHQITDIDLPQDPWITLFHSNSMPIGRYKRSLIPHLLNTAKALIPSKWGQPITPSIQKWLQKVSEVCLMEDLTYIARGTSKRHTSTWAPWSSFITTPCYRDLIFTNPQDSLIT